LADDAFSAFVDAAHTRPYASIGVLPSGCISDRAVDIRPARPSRSGVHCRRPAIRGVVDLSGGGKSVGGPVE